VVSSHQVPITADELAEQADYAAADMVILPGGMPGTTHLGESPVVLEQCRAFAKDRYVAAICAAPIALHAFGVIDGKTVTGYPGTEKLSTRPGLKYTGNLVEHDGNIITGKAPGAAPYFAAEIARVLGINDATVRGVLAGMFIQA
jgi:4-methyl-5(b-hydroxyethyl)-thiazole monophosphate biosynthesis